ncbi:MAG: hypothetical protein NTW04_05955, partial [Elusimicrobia bacterium]|nr:hypothetical protein [Elusimicrobiota bacterium]
MNGKGLKLFAQGKAVRNKFFGPAIAVSIIIFSLASAGICQENESSAPSADMVSDIEYTPSIRGWRAIRGTLDGFWRILTTLEIGFRYTDCVEGIAVNSEGDRATAEKYGETAKAQFAITEKNIKELESGITDVGKRITQLANTYRNPDELNYYKDSLAELNRITGRLNGISNGDKFINYKKYYGKLDTEAKDIVEEGELLVGKSNDQMLYKCLKKSVQGELRDKEPEVKLKAIPFDDAWFIKLEFGDFLASYS